MEIFLLDKHNLVGYSIKFSSDKSLEKYDNKHLKELLPKFGVKVFNLVSYTWCVIS